ncbi:ABC transporter permease [Cohnella sp. REN36]|uniref:ABC transporter permease n=1 Tax=Cohnella sp. REN36 TaxID=2887347 RepID=UPI001D144D61|nr:ABC transporter permease [Cohnella sp. REN36]MCC3374347.1 ABC transporter permease [Cohnella sp. REN36]
MDRKIWLMSPAVFLLLCFCVVPLFIMVYYSFLSDGTGGHWTVQNYMDFFQKDIYLKLTWKTVKMSFYVTVISLLISYPMAYVMVSIIQGGKNMLLMAIIIPFWTSQLVRAYSWQNLLRDGGLLEIGLRKLHLIGSGPLGLMFTSTAVIIAMVHIFFPYMVITIYMSLEKVDGALVEASKSLKAGPLTTFRRIVLPLSKPGIISGCILVFVPSLGVFVEPRILGGTQGTVIGTVIEDQFFEIYGWNFGAAVSFILLAIILLSMAVLSRFAKEEA